MICHVNQGQSVCFATYPLIKDIYYFDDEKYFYFWFDRLRRSFFFGKSGKKCCLIGAHKVNVRNAKYSISLCLDNLLNTIHNKNASWNTLLKYWEKSQSWVSCRKDFGKIPIIKMKLVSHKFEEYESLIRTFENFNTFLLQDSHIRISKTKHQVLRKKTSSMVFFFLAFSKLNQTDIDQFLKNFNQNCSFVIIHTPKAPKVYLLNDEYYWVDKFNNLLVSWVNGSIELRLSDSLHAN